MNSYGAIFFRKENRPLGISLTASAKWYCMVKRSTMKRKWSTGDGMKFPLSQVPEEELSRLNTVDEYIG